MITLLKTILSKLGYNLLSEKELCDIQHEQYQQGYRDGQALWD